MQSGRQPDMLTLRVAIVPSSPQLLSDVNLQLGLGCGLVEAATTCYVATNSGLANISGKYFSDCNEDSTSNLGSNLAEAARLWPASEFMVRRRVPDFTPAKVLDFGAGTGSAMWAMMEVWPQSLETINLVEPSQSMQRAGQSLLKGLKNLPLIQSYGSIQSLSKHANKSGRQHDLVIAVLVEPGTPQGSNIISQMRSHILWMEKRRSRKLQNAANKASNDLMTRKTGAFVVAPCPHDGACPLQNTDKYCHFVQRLERTSSQRAYKRSKNNSLRGFEDEKFSYIVFRRGTRPRGPWPLDGMKFETLKEIHAKRIPDDLDIDTENQFTTKASAEDDQYENHPAPSCDSDMSETDSITDIDDAENYEVEKPRADLGSGWGRIIYMPLRRGKRVEFDVCRAMNYEGTEGSFDRVVVTQSNNPLLHHQARRSIWGDLWPLRSGESNKFYM
ncbi:unnamed protein product [Fraxinus pennsylvanica]|uniref:Uncharacterized protein n=1 Tax=Fraxinus pennsylvanica TaxID=56036 RepID=A0AAD1ZLV3_9LAMI|nr:unnamed protein product [Fraxinus pennsylvanica]